MMNSNDGKHILIDPKKDLWFGFQGDELSYRQRINAAVFDDTLSQWLLDNVGEFGKEWWAELDKEHDSLRAVFKDLSMETWVAMTWCDNRETSE